MKIRRRLASISCLMGLLLVLCIVKSPHVALVVPHSWLVLLQLLSFVLLRLSEIKGVRLNVASVYLVTQVLPLLSHVFGWRD
jgi:drug/metabolite transporter (DMT)-like permease